MILDWLEMTNDYRCMNKDEFKVLFGSEKLSKGIPEIVQQKKKIISTLAPYKGKRGLQVTKVADSSISNYLSV